MPVEFTHGDACGDVLAMVGMDIVLPCTAMGYPQPSFSWKRNGQPLDIENNARKFTYCLYVCTVHIDMLLIDA